MNCFRFDFCLLVVVGVVIGVWFIWWWGLGLMVCVWVWFGVCCFLVVWVESGVGFYDLYILPCRVVWVFWVCCCGFGFVFV